MEQTTISISVTVEFAEQARIAAARQNVSRSAYIRKAAWEKMVRDESDAARANRLTDQSESYSIPEATV